MQSMNESSHDGPDRGIVKSLLRHFELAVVVCIVVLAVLLGVLNNLRVSDERKVKWFDAPADRADLETTEEVAS